MRPCAQPAIAKAAIRAAPSQRPGRGRTAIAAVVFRAIVGLLASWKSRPTSRVGSQHVQIASGMPNRESVPCLLTDPESWLSTQVYTPFGRAAVFEIIFFRFPQVLAGCIRKGVCQNFHSFEIKCTFVNASGVECADCSDGDVSKEGDHSDRARFRRDADAAALCGVRNYVAHRGPSESVFLNRRGQPLTRFGIHAMVERYAATVAATLPSLAGKRVSRTRSATRQRLTCCVLAWTSTQFVPGSVTSR